MERPRKVLRPDGVSERLSPCIPMGIVGLKPALLLAQRFPLPFQAKGCCFEAAEVTAPFQLFLVFFLTTLPQWATRALSLRPLAAAAAGKPQPRYAVGDALDCSRVTGSAFLRHRSRHRWRCGGVLQVSDVRAAFQALIPNQIRKGKTEAVSVTISHFLAFSFADVTVDAVVAVTAGIARANLAENQKILWATLFLYLLLFEKMVL